MNATLHFSEVLDHRPSLFLNRRGTRHQLAIAIVLSVNRFVSLCESDKSDLPPRVLLGGSRHALFPHPHALPSHESRVAIGAAYDIVGRFSGTVERHFAERAGEGNLRSVGVRRPLDLIMGLISTERKKRVFPSGEVNSHGSHLQQRIWFPKRK